MTESDTLSPVELFEANALDVLTDGGWGADAPLGHWTSPHGALDIALPKAQVPTLCQALGGRDYAEVRSGDRR